MQTGSSEGTNGHARPMKGSDSQRFNVGAFLGAKIRREISRRAAFFSTFFYSATRFPPAGGA